MIVLALVATSKVSTRIESLLLNLLFLTPLLSILMTILCSIIILRNSSYCRVLSIYHALSDMPNFSIKYNYSRDSVVHHETAVVRASSPDVAKDKLVRFLTRSGQFHLDNFKFDKISISSYNLILV